MLTRHLTAVASGLSKRNMASLASAYRAPIPTSEYVAPSNAVATTVLDNGVKVVSVAGGKTFPSIVVDINAGSSYETYETAGTFHFLKYFAYKSTQTLSGLRSTRLIEDLTQKYVVKNGREEFTYTAVLNGPEEAKDFLQLQADILRPRVQEWEVNEVRDLVQHDAEVKSNDASFKLNNAVHETAFRSQGIGRPVFAPAYNLDNINETVLRQHVDDFFVGSRIAVVGNSVAEHDRFVKYVADSLGQLPTSGRAIAKEESKYFGGEFRQAAPGGTSITLAYPTKGFAEGYISYVILKLLGSSRGVHPGSGLTSRLYAVGQKHAWAQFDPYLVFHANNGFLGIKGRSGSAGKAELLASTLEAELRRLSTEAVPKQELDRAVRAANIAFSNWSDSALSHATFTASNTLHHGQALGPVAVTPADIQTFAKKLLANRPTVVAFGDSTGLLPR